MPLLLRQPRRQQRSRPGAALIEFAYILPVLMLLILGSLDFGRAFFDYVIVTNFARNGALYISDPNGPGSRYSSLTQAAVADAPTSMQGQMTASSTGPDKNNNYTVTVTYPFTTLVNYGFLPHSVTITRTVTMRLLPVAPN